MSAADGLVQLEPEHLTERQAARRRAVIEAAVDLASEGGYEAVQMRDVAERAGVALGTIYHYFASKDILLSMALVEWVSGLEAIVDADPPSGRDTRTRVLELLERVTGSMKSAPDLSHAMVTALCSRGPEFDWCQEQMHRAWSAALRKAFRGDVVEAERDRIIRVLEHVWFSSLIAWTNEWMTLEEASEELTKAAETLVPTEPDQT